MGIDHIISRAERRQLSRVREDFPYLAPLLDRVERIADDRRTATETAVAAVQNVVEAAERRERDTAIELARARRRIVELETGPTDRRRP